MKNRQSKKRSNLLQVNLQGIVNINVSLNGFFSQTLACIFLLAFPIDCMFLWIGLALNVLRLMFKQLLLLVNSKNNFQIFYLIKSAVPAPMLANNPTNTISLIAQSKLVMCSPITPKT